MNMEATFNKSQDLWIPFKKLEKVIRYTLTKPSEPALLVLEDCLRKNKQNFLNLLKNPPKNAANREELNKGLVTGITIPSIGHQILSKELVQETLIISDMYDLNEYMALDLLCTAQMYMSHYPGLNRGLVAILLYYDGRCALTNTLRILVQVRSGILWTSEASPDVVKFITRYTDQLLADGLFNRIFELLNTLDLSKEVELLQKNRALGGPKHHRQVLDIFEKIRQNLADIVYMWAAQSGLPKEPTFALINYLKVTKLEADPSGVVDNITLTLQIGLMYALDLSMLQKIEEDDELIKKLPLVSENGFIDAVIQELNPDRSKWNSEGLQALTMFTWGLSLATLRLSMFANLSPGATEQADIFVDYAIQMKVFDFLHRFFLENETIFQEEFYVRRLHSLITDFIVLMHSKVKDLRLRADDTARTIQLYTQEGLEAPSNLPQFYQNLLLTIAKLYSQDPLNLKLILDYWKSVDSSTQSRPTSRAISLFKFVRQAGELLPPTLFVPYLKMLSSLASCSQAARHTFNLLKQNGPGSITVISWDHFFNSLNQYYISLRQETSNVSDTMYPVRGHSKGITPMELEGLHCVLLLIRTVATHDEFSRIALCEHPGWAPLNVLLGLVSCSVPIPLKANLLLTLAALAKSPETARQLWNNLEASQIVVTVPSTSSYQPRGVKTELEEIETSMEEYPLTRSLLTLFNVLTSSGIPRTLGVGVRKPGFDPYLTIIIDSIFTKFNTRAYKNQEEKWDIVKLCLELFLKFLHQYDPQASDFASIGPNADTNAPPGFHIMAQLNSKTELFRLVMFILYEGTALLDTYANFSGKKHLEESTLLCLKLIDYSLQLQTQFFAFVTSVVVSSVSLVKLNKLLLGINPNTGKPDHLLVIAHYITYNSWLDEHAYYCVKILSSVISSVNVNQHFLGLLTANEQLGPEILQGFVECLTADDDEDDKKTDEQSKTKSNLKLIILKFLKQCLDFPAPNVSHYLFGFNIKEDIKNTIFQQPGVMGFPYTCLHALFAILNRFLKNKSDGIASNGAVIESAYAMCYLLCTNRHTSKPVLRFIRSKHDFLENHIEALPLNTKCDATTLNQISWLLKIVAIEIKISSESNHISQLNSLIRLCLGHSQKPASISMQSDIQAGKDNSNKSVNRLIALLNNLNFEQEVNVVPQWDFFDNNLMEKLLQNCEHTIGGIRIINVKKLHRILMDELGTLQGGAVASQKQLILKEIEKVLLYAVKYNNSRNEMAASVRFMESWKQLVEILFITVPTDVLNLNSKQTYLIQILHSLLFLIVPGHISTDLGNIISEATLMLFVCLRQSYILEKKQTKIQSSSVMSSSLTLYSSTVTLQHILRKIAEWIIVSEVTAQKIRINLYGALLYSINILNEKETTELDNKRVFGSTYVPRLDNVKFTGKNNEPLVLLNELSSYGQKLFDILCHDCTSGHDVSKMLALATIDCMIEVDQYDKWVKFLSLRGYLKHLIDSLLESDDKLRNVLDPTPESLRPLYLYESKMTLLCRIVMSRAGAQVLLEQKMLGCLASMRVFEYHPEIKLNTNAELEIDILPSIEKRYHQIFFPMLYFCDAIITSLGSDNNSSCLQVLHCLISHAEVIELILRSGNPAISTGSLQELALLTGVIARITNHNTATLLSNLDSLGDNTAFFNRIKKLMLALYPRFVLTEHVDSRDQEKSIRLLNCLKVSCHLALFARNCIVGHGIEHRSSDVIFPPSLNESPINEFRHQYNKVVDQSPGLGVVVKQLIQSVEHYHKEKGNLDALTEKISSIPGMNSTALQEFIPNLTDKLNIMDCRLQVNEILTKQLKNKQQEIKYCTFLIENSLYLIWAHLDYYMLRAIPKTAFSRFSTSTSTTYGDYGGTLDSAAQGSWRVTADDVHNLKQNLVSVFNETFSSKLVAVAQEQTVSNRGFIEALLRRIKRLIQFVPIN